MDAIVVNNAIHNLSTALREQDNARPRKGQKLTLVTVGPTTSTPCSGH